MARRVQDLPGRTVHIAVRGARDQRLPAGPLSGEDKVVQLDLPVRRGRPDHKRTADLAPVAAVVGADADGEKIALLDPAVGGPVAAQPGVGPGGYRGREGRAVGAVVDEPALQLQREMPLGAAHQDRLQEFAESLVRDLRRDPQAGDLLLVLDKALLLDGETEVGEAQPGRHRAHRPVSGDGQMVFLDGQRLHPGRPGQLCGRDRRIAGRGRQDGQPQLLIRTAFGGIAGGRTGAEQDVFARAEQEYRAGRRSAREIADIGGAGNQSPGAAGRRAPVTQPAAAEPIHL